MTNSPRAAYRRQILASKGLTEADLHDKGPKTPYMKYMEFKFGKPIEELLQGTLAECATRLGVSRTSIAKWKRRLGMDVGYKKHFDRVA